MNLSWVLVIFVLGNLAISSGEPYSLYQDKEDEPLALIKKRNPSRLELAIPQKSKTKNFRGWDNYADYAYDTTVDEDGPVEEFMIACPARSYIAVEREIQSNWKTSNDMPEYVRLLLLDEYKDAENECSHGSTPGVEKVEMKNAAGELQYCGQSEAEIYNVGFWVSKREELEVKFVPVYKICYSTAEGKGTLYTVHRIQSPTLLLQEAWEYYELKPKDGLLYRSSLDKKDENGKLIYLFKKQYAYQIVPLEDMPLTNWGLTTLFSFNYTPITLNKVLMKDMIAVDNYIRLYSKKTNKPLTLYSGIHEEVVNKAFIPAARDLLSTPTQVISFWRIIVDDEGSATMIVIQHSARMKCNDDTFICDKYEEPVILRDYKNNGCIYTCSVNNEVIERLGLPRDEETEQSELPRLKIKGDLFLIFPRERKRGSKLPENEEKVPIKRLPKYVSISEFLGKVSLKSALENADPDLASTVKVHEKSKEHDYGRSKVNDGGSGGVSGSSAGGGGGSWFLPAILLGDFSGTGGGGDLGGGGGFGGD